MSRVVLRGGWLRGWLQARGAERLPGDVRVHQLDFWPLLLRQGLA